MAQCPEGVGLDDVGLGVVVDSGVIVALLLCAESHLLEELCIALAALLKELAGLECLGVVLLLHKVAERAQCGLVALNEWR